MASAGTKPTSSLPTLKPVQLLDSSIAQLYTHIHPFLVLSAYFFQFPSIVADPVATLSSMLLPLGAAQVAYSVLCLPPVGHTETVKKVVGARMKTVQVNAGVPKRIMVCVHDML